MEKYDTAHKKDAGKSRVSACRKTQSLSKTKRFSPKSDC
ncbi:hypothetical protein X560_2393 [Listeria fleischmannii 1991]|uniref:Uncharacterized protein n=1 Tax=Listeria fleischmannii 1991 TaxID=1430899 RepID=A0A0J8J1Q2_9LIST|nr:hypothetical protein X560_2393 [Listeria fleischmannii 1991]